MTFENQPVNPAPGPAVATSGLAVSSLVVGVVSIIFAVFVFPLGLIGGVIGLILGFIARGKIRRGEASGNGVALGGIISSVLAVVIAILVGVVLVAFLSEVVDCLDPDLTEEQVAECVQEGVTGSG